MNCFTVWKKKCHGGRESNWCSAHWSEKKWLGWGWGAKWEFIPAKKEDSKSQNCRSISTARIRDNQGAFCSQAKSGLNLGELLQPFLSRCVNVKVTVNLADNYFPVYWQGFSSGLKWAIRAWKPTPINYLPSFPCDLQNVLFFPSE